MSFFADFLKFCSTFGGALYIEKTSKNWPKVSGKNLWCTCEPGFFGTFFKILFLNHFWKEFYFGKAAKICLQMFCCIFFWKPECITIGKWKNSYVKIYIQTISQLGSQYWKTEIGLYTEPSLTRVYQNLFSSLVSSLFFREIIFARKKFWKLISRKKNYFYELGPFSITH